MFYVTPLYGPPVEGIRGDLVWLQRQDRGVRGVLGSRNTADTTSQDRVHVDHVKSGSVLKGRRCELRIMGSYFALVVLFVCLGAGESCCNEAMKRREAEGEDRWRRRRK